MYDSMSARFELATVGDAGPVDASRAAGDAGPVDVSRVATDAGRSTHRIRACR